MMQIVDGGLDDSRVVALLEDHSAMCFEVTPVGSTHVFDLSQLKDPAVHFYSAWEEGQLLGVGAFKIIAPGHGEVKSMHTTEAARRRGVGGALLLHIIDQARKAGLQRLSLETGSFGYFEPAVALYARYKFKTCGPFEGYKADPNSTFMTREI